MNRVTTLVATAVLILAALAGGASPAAAAPQTPTGFCGAGNMAMAGDAMSDAMMDHTNDNGDAGMARAVALTACS